ncbi:pentapeptide repeat-containing protein [Pseudomonas sp. S32]|uniref:pentapeptide repeat-containing protein n=1 Tax=Pseudomonas sp. S32 TaxID=2767448 RepID=UPI00191465DB|nr:pentapeptide repeat-containing protein [Pseudomonas sp. S32]MBK5007370.1 pentapeptide repeat-containing protein [Pseudomonas sp. S32]
MRSPSVLDNPIKTALLILAFAIVVVVFITADWDWLSSHILPNTVIGLYKKDFWENVMVEMHGMVVELAVVGILLLWLDGRRDRKQQLSQCREDLKNYAKLDFPEAHLKKIGILKTLISANQIGLDARYLHLSGRSLSDVNIKNWNVIGLKLNDGKLENSTFEKVEARSSNFVKCTLRNVVFEEGSLYRCKFEGAKFRQVSFKNCRIEKAEFTHCDMPNTLFDQVSLSGVKFEGANLAHCSFKSAFDIDVGELSKAKNLDHIAIDDKLLIELLKLRPDIKYQKRRIRP